MDGIVLDPFERTIAYLTEIQVDAYGGYDAARKVLLVEAVADPAILFIRDPSLPWYSEVGHG